MSTAPALPVLSLAALQAGSKTEQARLRAALRTHGFFYLTAHGIPQPLLDTIFDLQASFFARPDDEERVGLDRGLNLGWTPLRQERLDEKRSKDAGRGGGGDLKESFYLGQGVVGLDAPTDSADASDAQMRRQELPPTLDARRAELETLWKEARRVALDVLDAFAAVLGLEPGFFAPHHTGGLDRLRLIHYPPAPPTIDQSEDGDIRASQHSDYGSCTLLFQKEVGGLQVQTRGSSPQGGEWLDVPPLPDALVINVADALEFWTAGEARSAVHRVRMPRAGGGEEAGSRYSIAFFVQPDAETTLDPALLYEHQRRGRADNTQMGEGKGAHSYEEKEEEGERSLAARRRVLADLLRAKGIPLDLADGRPPTGGEYLQARLRATYS